MQKNVSRVRLIFSRSRESMVFEDLEFSSRSARASCNSFKVEYLKEFNWAARSAYTCSGKVDPFFFAHFVGFLWLILLGD